MKPQKLVGLVAAAAVLVVAAAWYMTLWKPEVSRLKTAQANLAQVTGQVSTDQAKLAQLNAQVPKVKSERATLEKLVQAVPDGPSLDQALRTVRAAASKAGIKVQSLSVPPPSGWGGSGAAPSSSTGPLDLSISLAATGRQSQLLGFVRALDAQPRLYVVTAFGLNAPGTGRNAQESTTFSISTFYASSSATSPVFPG